MTERQITLINDHARLCTQLEQIVNGQDRPTDLIERGLAELSTLNSSLGALALDPLVDAKATHRRTSRAVKIMNRAAKVTQLNQYDGAPHTASSKIGFAPFGKTGIFGAISAQSGIVLRITQSGRAGNSLLGRWTSKVSPWRIRQCPSND
jgi:hypothetical protein